MSNDNLPPITKKRADEIKKRYVSTAAAQARFGPLFDTTYSFSELHYHECSEGFTVVDVDKLLALACELELDTCSDYLYRCAPVNAINALLLLVASDRSLTDKVACRTARRCAETYAGKFVFFAVDRTAPHLIALLQECGPPAIPCLATEMRNLLLSPHLPESSWLAASSVGEAMRGIILECYKDIPLAISLTDQFCAPLLEFSKHPTAMSNRSNQENAGYLLSALVDIAILITDEKEVLELCRSKDWESEGYDHHWIDVLRLFSLEPHPQDEKLRERGNRMDWVIQTWNENHPDKQYPFPRGVVDGPFPGQPGYELPKRLFRHKYCVGSPKCRYNYSGISVEVKVCERCKHTYYCSEACQRHDWYGHFADANLIEYESYPPMVRTSPLKRLTAYHKSRFGYSSHRSHCLLVQAYKQWVKIDKQQRKAER